MGAYTGVIFELLTFREVCSFEMGDEVGCVDCAREIMVELLKDVD